MSKAVNKNPIPSTKFDDPTNRFQILSLATKEGVWEYDIVSDKSYYNDGMVNLFGYSREEMGDNHTWWSNNVHPLDKSTVIGQLDALLAGTESVWWGQYNFLCKNGEYKKILDRLFIVRDKDNKPLRIIGTMQDIAVLHIFENQVEKLNDQHRKNMIRAIIESEENERKNISDELHENVNQVLAAISLKISKLKEMNPDESGLSEVHEMLNYSIKEINTIAKRLSPLMLETLGLKKAIEDQLEELKTKNTIDYSIIATDEIIQKSDKNITRLLYRIAQMQIVNIAKHSGAKNVFINIKSTNNKVSMTIFDDGRGIDLKSFKFGRGFSTIQERVEAFGGIFKLQNAEEEKGCILTIVI